MGAKPEHTFRKCLFGGISASDVYRYLRSSAERHLSELQASEAELQKSVNERNVLVANMGSLNSEITRLASQLKTAEETIRVRESSLSAAQKELAEATRQFEETDGAFARLNIKCAELEMRLAEHSEDAAGYPDISTVYRNQEALAIRRAEAIEDGAREAAEKLREDMEQQAAAYRERIAGISGETKAAAVSAAAEVEKLQNRLADIIAALEDTGLRTVPPSPPPPQMHVVRNFVPEEFFDPL
ncbi:MAG: hypothetical protein LBI44_06885 [Oscillospiraceae bacterium]|jgi:chromosome segregation ATPase|nr:hypothetical protein [Oscillospiraceae bacterium]